MPILIVSGCSIAHGAATFHGFMHPENVKNSFSQFVADALQVDLLNVAQSGSSNEQIFHSTMDAIHDTADIHSVIVTWTYNTRLCWTNNGRHWFFNPVWASTMLDVYRAELRDRRVGPVRLSGDTVETLDQLEQQHKFLVTHYLSDLDYLERNQKNFSQAIQAVCNQRQIKLIELSGPDLHPCCQQGRHPTRDQHQQIAQDILSKHYAC